MIFKRQVFYLYTFIWQFFFFSNLENMFNTIWKRPIVHWIIYFVQDDSGFYKNVLLELAQKELFCIPKYETVKCGPSHMPTFFSTVKVDGEIFHGKAGRSKKQAEMKAAKAAYTAFKDRKSFALFPLVSMTFVLENWFFFFFLVYELL